jgi:hypothetical protein
MEFKVSRSCIYLYFFWNVMRTLLLLLLFYFFWGRGPCCCWSDMKSMHQGRTVSSSLTSVWSNPDPISVITIHKRHEDKNKQIDRAQVAVHPQPRWIFARSAIHLAYITKDTCCVYDRSIDCRPILFYFFYKKKRRRNMVQSHSIRKCLPILSLFVNAWLG